MSNVVVHVNNRPYTMQCPDGEEDNLQELARLLDGEVTRIRQSVGSVGDIRLLVMAGLMVADRLAESTKKIAALEEQVQGLREARNAAQAETAAVEDLFSKRINAVSSRLEGLAREMGK